ncbi:MAG TPA: orotate phosphoribosyltransferase [Thermomicrobiales bacterium]|nr:orotate phosphoribosyltransferase [Thermomicrobiales bacterium]
MTGGRRLKWERGAASVDEDFLATLRRIGALKEGHFLLSSGRHSDRYIEKFDLLRQPRAASAACRVIADRFADDAIDVVVGPTTGGILLAFETARQLGTSAAYAERDEGSQTRVFRRGQSFTPGARVLLVDDILTTGGAVRETLAALANQPVTVAAIAVLVDRSGGAVAFEASLFALATIEVATWEPADCPLCAAGMPLVKPGTTPGI